MLDSEMEAKLPRPAHAPHLHPCRRGTTNEKAHQAMDGRSYESMEGRGRAKQEARAENNAGAIVELTRVMSIFSLNFLGVLG